MTVVVFVPIPPITEQLGLVGSANGACGNVS
jgi:hypothetical protein